jgi:hypothetical protein
MAEVGLIASLVSIAGAAVQLTRTLCAFGSTTSAAREHVDHIAKNVSFYSGVLELLVEQFGNDRPILLHPIASLSAYLSFHTIKHHKTSTFPSSVLNSRLQLVGIVKAFFFISRYGRRVVVRRL